MANTTPSISRQRSNFDCFRNEKFLQARASKFLTPKEQDFDTPIYLNYGSTGRPPGKSHLRHSPKEFTNILEFPYHPFDIFFIEITNNNDNCYYICYDNGGIFNYNKDNNKDDNNNKAGESDGDKDDTKDYTIVIVKPFADRIKLNHYRQYNLYFNYSKAGPSSTSYMNNYNTSTDDNEDNDKTNSSSHHPDIIYDNDFELRQAIKLISNNNSNNFDLYSSSTSSTTTTNTRSDNDKFHRQ
jgi:hypothetical protein